ncbi:MAG: hypothetical protein J07AB43_00540 [Candidatus Nanosalina sp. J07AB43]|nr:MAG: hypothetical protein J07AB43_00540 [Candidatus Nanosalina sp. J07AB43]
MSNYVEFNKLESYRKDEYSVRISYETRQFGIWQTRCSYSRNPAALTHSFEKTNYRIDEFTTEPSINMFTKSEQEYITHTAGIALVTVFQDLIPDSKY